jgi:hypothetical protein
MCFILSDLKCYGALFQASEIMFEVQRKRSNEKITQKKKGFQLRNLFFSFLSF